MGALNTLVPFSEFPIELRFQALENLSPKPYNMGDKIWVANYSAFVAGQNVLYCWTLLERQSTNL